MIIANPIYDVVFKYLMDDVQAATTIISAILSREIVELIPLPQEQIIHSDKQNLTTIRVDFMAIMKQKNGKLEKVLIEMQKAKNLTDTLRFRRYLGENYIKIDTIDGKNVQLPIICIYFIGYPVNVPNAIAFNKVNYVDQNGVNVTVQEPLMELLAHETCFIFINNLSKEEKSNPLYLLLSIFDQDLVKSKDIKYLLESDNFDNFRDEKINHLIKRLHMASLEAELLEKAKLEEDFNRDLDIVIGKFIKEAQEERKLKEEAKVKEQIERQLKEEAKHKEQIERQLKEEAIASQHGAIRSLFDKGVNTSEIANIFKLSEIQINIILNKQ